MKKNTFVKFSMQFRAVCAIAVICMVVTMIACNKSKTVVPVSSDDALRAASGKPLLQSEQITSVVTIANIRTSADGSTTRVMFNQNEQILSVPATADVSTLRTAFAKNQAVQVTFNPWQATVSQVSLASAQDQDYFQRKALVGGTGSALKLDATVSNDVIDHASEMGVLNLTTTGLTNVIPDFNTAQLMFDYIAHQCCELPGPYAIDHCITFQYCEDGCYARAHKMCWIINNKYHYGTQKVFSFANDAANVDELCVKAEKWNGCCINWWYHVAPLVTIKTTTGPKAYVFDPAMFDQPVLLSTWLHAQENPACVPSGDVPHVTMINIQPTTAYSPSGTSGYYFDTDPSYSNTNSTLVSYRHLISCP